MSSTYSAVLAELYARTRSGIKLGLNPITKVLRTLGNPEQQMRSIVVAGTNGKGFTSSLLARALELDGHRVGLYTSPHLLRYTERIRIDGVQIDEASVVRHFATVKRAETQAALTLTFFEATTVMACLAFAEASCDIAVFEVGMGGRLDATNAMPNSLAIITPVDFDHMMYLGDTLTEIAAEKAGIIKPNGAVVLAPQPAEAKRAILQIAHERDARVYETGTVYGQAHKDSVSNVLPTAPFQRTNVDTVATACAVLQQQGVRCSPHALQRALSDFRWHGRYDVYEADGHTTACRVIYDGAHNPAGMDVLLRALQADTQTRSRPIHAVFSALVDKPAEALLDKLVAHVDSVVMCPNSSHRSRTIDDLQALAARHPNKVTAANTPALAFTKAAERAKHDNGTVLVTGSLFLVADVMAHHLSLDKDPPVDG